MIKRKTSMMITCFHMILHKNPTIIITITIATTKIATQSTTIAIMIIYILANQTRILKILKTNIYYLLMTLKDLAKNIEDSFLFF